MDYGFFKIFTLCANAYSIGAYESYYVLCHIVCQSRVRKWIFAYLDEGLGACVRYRFSDASRYLSFRAKTCDADSLQMSYNHLDNSVGFLIHGIKQKMKRRMCERLKKCGITTEQRSIVLILSERGAMTQSKLCELVGSEPSNLTITLKRLECKGLVKKIDHPSDARAYLVDATDDAKKMAPELQALSSQISGSLLEGISDEDMAVTMKTLKKMHDNLQ